MKNIKACVVYPVYIDINVADSVPSDQINELILDEADKLFAIGGMDPVIHELTINHTND